MYFLEWGKCVFTFSIEFRPYRISFWRRLGIFISGLPDIFLSQCFLPLCPLAPGSYCSWRDSANPTALCRNRLGSTGDRWAILLIFNIILEFVYPYVVAIPWPNWTNSFLLNLTSITGPQITLYLVSGCFWPFQKNQVHTVQPNHWRMIIC